MAEYAAPSSVVSREDMSPGEWRTALESRFTSICSHKWTDKRLRPGGRPDAPTGTPTRSTTPRNQWLDTLWSYNVGDPPLPQIAEEYRELFRDVLRKARSNYAPMCLSAMGDRMELQAVSTQEDSDTEGDTDAADVMEESGFAAQFKDVLDYLFGMGESYAMVVPAAGPDDEPSIHAIDPRRCIGIPDRRNPVRLSAALVKECDDITGEEISYLFLPGKKYEYRQPLGGVNPPELKPYTDLIEFEPINDLDDLGGIPIVRLDNKNGLGEYEPHIDLLDRIIDTTLQRIIGFWYQSLRQRAVGVDEDDDDDDYVTEDGTDTEDSLVAQPVDRNKPIDWDKLAYQAGPGSLWKFPKDFDIWESQQTDFGPFINAKRDDVKEFAAVTSTPLYLITPDDANGSALGAGLQRESATSKVRDRRSRISPSLKLLWRIVFAMKGRSVKAREIRLHWGPIEFLSLAEQASADNQAVSLSTEDRCERIWQMSPEDTRRNVTRLTAEKLMNATLPTAGGTGPPGQESGGGSSPTPQQQADQAVNKPNDNAGPTAA